MRAPRIALFVAALTALVVGCLVPITARDQATILPPRDASSMPPARGEPGIRRIPVGTGSISGVVRDATSGRPLRNARITLSGAADVTLPAGGDSPTGVLAPLRPATAPGIPQPASGGPLVVQPGSGRSPISIGVSRATTTDGQGQFHIDRLPAGLFSLTVSQPQYLTGAYGQKRPAGQGTQLHLLEGQQLRVTIPMTRSSAISGTVTDENGDPAPTARISVWRYILAGGVKRLQQTGGGTSDDRGVYRVYNLQPGDYVVGATPQAMNVLLDQRMNADMQAIEQAIATGAVQAPARAGLPATVAVPVPAAPAPGAVVTMNDQPPGYLPTYFGGTNVRRDAQMVHLSGGDERDGVDIQTRPVQATNIRGLVATAPMAGVAVSVSLESDEAGASQVQGARPGADGRFTLRDLAPGKYTILAQTIPAPPTPVFVNGMLQAQQISAPPRLDDSQRLWARAVVTVTGEPSVDVRLDLQPGKSISGIVAFEMERPPDLTRAALTVTLVPAPGETQIGMLPQARVGPDGRFTLNGVIPGRYTIRAPGQTKSSVIDGQDTMDFPFEFTGERDVLGAVVTMTDKNTELSGSLTDSSGGPGTDYTIVTAAADQRFWTPGSRRITTTRPATDGRFVIRLLPPGDYLLAAVTDLDAGAQYDPEFLKSIASASMHVSLAEGAKVVQNIRVAR